MKYEEVYDQETTNETFKELENIGHWFNTLYHRVSEIAHRL